MRIKTVRPCITASDAVLGSLQNFTSGVLSTRLQLGNTILPGRVDTKQNRARQGKDNSISSMSGCVAIYSSLSYVFGLTSIHSVLD